MLAGWGQRSFRTGFAQALNKLLIHIRLEQICVVTHQRNRVIRESHLGFFQGKNCWKAGGECIKHAAFSVQNFFFRSIDF